MQGYYFYRHYAADPFFNMAFDEAMLRTVIARPEFVMLRLYSWQPGTITFGLNQEAAKALDLDNLGLTPLIRRATGGRAVYHDPSELTYSVAANLAAAGPTGWGKSVSQVYLYLAQFLQDFLSDLGRGSRIVRRSSEPERAPTVTRKQPCFASAARYELLTEDGKVVASAQRRVGTALLQHGSIKLAGLAGHPALASPTAVDDLQAIESRPFDDYAERFERAFRRRTDLSTDTNPPVLETSNEFTQGLENLRSNPLDRRDTFEQNGRSKSL